MLEWPPPLSSRGIYRNGMVSYQPFAAIDGYITTPATVNNGTSTDDQPFYAGPPQFDAIRTGGFAGHIATDHGTWSWHGNSLPMEQPQRDFFGNIIMFDNHIDVTAYSALHEQRQYGKERWWKHTRFRKTALLPVTDTRSFRFAGFSDANTSHQLIVPDTQDKTEEEASERAGSTDIDKTPTKPRVVSKPDGPRLPRKPNTRWTRGRHWKQQDNVPKHEPQRDSSSNRVFPQHLPSNHSSLQGERSQPQGQTLTGGEI
ncbi:hypothetical protein EIP91_001072 [Steccherinum ochraceum]|uniref:Uncharacterized protein n=1 Tax=Steccherinum ochraceum TaxID=92696 RepID=A0A4R0RVA4_9APHY|nr:hypothetical protein EIP91_001072 [Steccherinum ochraceum]